MGWKSMFSFQPYGQQWRDRRRAFWQEFNPEHGRINHRPIQLHYARDLVRHLYESPIDFEKHARHMIAAAVLTITYGLDIEEKEDPYIALADKALKHLDVAFIGTYMVDVLPFLRILPQWMPGAGFQTTGESSRRDLRLMVELPYATARKLLQEGRGGSSLVHRALNRGHVTASGKEERDIMETAATAYLGVPHSLVSDDEYKGYYLPNGSIIFYNVWAILHDELIFPEPNKFNPLRFFKDGEINTLLRDRVMSTFGFGRRICPGRHYALDGLWLSMASILSVFTIGKAADGSGCPIDINLEYSADLNRHILPFKCSIKPRSQRAEELIHECCRF
ncbi:hypothetical protein EYR38_002505 [Pleurotus pulmonarius]|nr:hypothetical protein EYR38_002505 [Pleurotus pulmonarius]